MFEHTDDLVAQALNLGRQGYHVLPLLIRDDGRKIPLIKWGAKASTDLDEVQSMPWEDATHVAVACEPSNLVVVDIDTYYNEYEGSMIEGDDLINEWRGLLDEYPTDSEMGSENYDQLYDPPWVTTVRNGLHAFLRADPERPMTNSVKDIAPMIDIRGVGGIVAIYANEMPNPQDLPPVPEWLYRMTEREREHHISKSPPQPAKYAQGEMGTRYGLSARENELNKIRVAWETDNGQFNKTLNNAAFAVGQLAGGGELEVGDAHQRLLDLMSELDVPPDQYKTLDSGFTSGYDRPRSARETLINLKINDETVSEHASKWLTGEELDRIPPPKWLLPGWLELNSVAQIFGPPKQGKTHIAHDLAASLSRGLSWPFKSQDGQDPVRVAYVVAEGVSGLGERKRAWETRYGRVGSMLYYPDAIQIGNDREDWVMAVEFLADWKPSLVIFDTQARCTVGRDENLPREMGMVVDCLEDLRKRTGACVLLVHHTSKYGDQARGTNAIEGALNTGIFVKKAYGRFRVRNPVQKNAEEADDVFFDLEEVGESVIPVAQVEMDTEDVKTKVEQTNMNMRIKQYLQDHSVPQSTSEIQDALGYARNNLSTALNKLTQSGDIIQSSEPRPTRRGPRLQSVYLWNHSRSIQE